MQNFLIGLVCGIFVWPIAAEIVKIIKDELFLRRLEREDDFEIKDDWY